MGSRRRISRAPALFNSKSRGLSEAIIIASAMMMEGNLQAMDRWITLMGELDRYHGLAAAQIVGRRRRASPRRSAARSRRIRPGVKSKGNFPPRKPLKFLETRKEFGLGAARAPRSDGTPPNPTESGPGKVEGKFSASQTLEIPRNAKGIGHWRSGSASPGRNAGRSAANPARGDHRGISVASFAAREADGKTELPGNGAATA